MKLTAQNQEELMNWIQILVSNNAAYSYNGLNLEVSDTIAQRYLGISAPKPASKKMSTRKVIGLTIAALFIIGIIIPGPKDSETNTASDTSQDTTSIDTVGLTDAQKQMMHDIAAQQERDGQIQALFSSWDGSLYSLKELVKENMHNPNSFEHVETRYEDKGDYILVAMKYRGENGFGAIRTEHIAAKVDLATGSILEIIK